MIGGRPARVTLVVNTGEKHTASISAPDGDCTNPMSAAVDIRRQIDGALADGGRVAALSKALCSPPAR